MAAWVETVFLPCARILNKPKVAQMKRFLFLTLILSFPLPLCALLEEPDSWFFGLLHHVDQWYLSDEYYFELDEDEHIPVRIAPLNIPLGDGDNSRFYEVDFPEIGLYIVLKQSDFSLPELGVTIQNSHPKVVSVKRYDKDSPLSEKAQVRYLCEREAEQLLYQERFRKSDWTGEQVQPLQKALAQILSRKTPAISGEQTFFVSKVSPYSNKIYVYWLEGNKIIGFSSGADPHTPEYWKTAPMGTRIIDLDTDVVTSLQQTAGSNAYVTKAWAARILYQCVAKGTRLRL